MKKVGCITFHSAHNYGSVLQAYALQEFVKLNFPDVVYKIINLRTKRQKELYSVFPKRASYRYKFFVLFNYFSLRKKHENFEKFINTKLELTEEFSDENITEERFDFDYYISGGDQCWNIDCADFSWLYYLTFVKKARKLSYSISLGPKALSASNLMVEKIKNCVNSYTCLSLREIESINQLSKILDKPMQQNIDPVLLLDKDIWTKLAGERIEKSAYIFLYILDNDRQAYDFATRLSKYTGKKVIISKPICKKDFFHHFTNRFDCGPVEFLNYILYADIVISTSFHGCVFASLFEKPLITLNAEKDNRRWCFLEKYGLANRNVKPNINDKEIEVLLDTVDFTLFKNELKREQNRSFEYLKNALGED